MTAKVREQAAIWATLVGGIATIVLWQVASFWVWNRRDTSGPLRPLDGWDRLAGFVLWNSIALGLGAVAFMGARLAPRRPRAVVLAAVLPFELLVLLFRIGNLFPPDGHTFFHLLTMVLVAGAAIGGVRLGRVERGGEHASPSDRGLLPAG